jgi:hypothetical protein
MKKLLFPVFCLLLIVSSCSKNKDDNNSTGTFSVKLNGQSINFTVESATFVRSASTHEKRLDITGLSSDGTKKLTLTFHEGTHEGNGITVKSYTIRIFNEDDPNTAADESDDSMDGFISYGTKFGNNNWLYETYAENGTFTVTSCNESTKKISGTFNISLVNLNDNSDVVEFTEGKFSNVTYIVLN